MREFVYGSNPKDGFFNYMRNTYINPKDFIKVTSDDYLNGNGFCDYPIIGSSPDSIIDGLDNTSWANNDDSDENKQKVDIDLGNETFALTDFVFVSACNAPSVLHILGSNDYTNFNEVCELSTFDVFKTKHFICNSKNKYYRYYRLKQTINIYDKYRLHIVDIEFFGKLRRRITMTCKNRYHHKILFTAIMYVFGS